MIAGHGRLLAYRELSISEAAQASLKENDRRSNSLPSAGIRFGPRHLLLHQLLKKPRIATTTRLTASSESCG